MLWRIKASPNYGARNAPCSPRSSSSTWGAFRMSIDFLFWLMIHVPGIFRSFCAVEMGKKKKKKKSEDEEGE